MIQNISIYKNNKTNLSIACKDNTQKPSFKALASSPTQSVSTTKIKIIDAFLKNKLTKSLFKTASLNPILFNVIMLAFVGIILKPITIMAVPGSNKEDKSYSAGKSVISSIVNTAAKLIIFVPFGKYIESLGKKALNATEKTKFPKLGTKEFNAYNYLINNGFAFVVTIAISAAIVELVAKVMNKIMPKKDSKQHNSQQAENDINKTSKLTEKTSKREVKNEN